jgi:hypothetical protein
MRIAALLIERPVRDLFLQVLIDIGPTQISSFVTADLALLRHGEPPSR